MRESAGGRRRSFPGWWRGSGGLVGGGAEVGRGWVSRELRDKGGFGRGLGGGWGRRGLGPAAEGGLRWPAGGAGEGTWWPAAVGGGEES